MRVATHTEPVNQAVVVTVDVPMLSRRLTFRSDWGPSRRAAYRWDFDELAANSTVEIDVAGRNESITADDTGHAVFEWDGRNAAGDRPGPAVATAKTPAGHHRVRLGRWDPRSIGLGGLLLSGYDHLDPTAARIHAATGRLKGNVAFVETADGYEASRNSGRYRVRFDRQGFVTEVVDADSGRSTASYRRDDAGLVSVSTSRLSIEIARSGHLVTIARDGWTLRLDLDDGGRVVAMTDPSDRPIRFGYDEGGRLRALTDAAGHRYDYDHDDDGRLVGLTDPGQGRVDVIRKDTEHGHRVTLMSAEGRESFYQVERLPDGTKVRTSRCCGRHPMVTRIQRDVIDVEQPDGTKTVNHRITGERRIVLPSGLTFSRTTTRGEVQVNDKTYTITRRATGTTSETPLGRRFELAETDHGLRITRPDRVIELTKDDRGRATRISVGEAAIDVEYGSVDLVTGARWSDGSSIGFEYDGSGWLTAQRMSDDRFVALERNGNGMVTAVTPPGSRPTLFDYDAPARLARVRFPSGYATEDHIDYGYDDDGLLVEKRAAGGPAIGFRRDVSGNITSIESGDSRVEFEYDNGRIVNGATSDGQITSFSYDGRLLTSIVQRGLVGGTLVYDYDESFRRSRISSGELSADIAYDADGDPSKVGDALIRRDEAGRIVSITAGVVTQTHTYAESGVLARMAVSVKGDEVWSVDYDHDDFRRIRAFTDSSMPGPVELTHDNAGRLVRASGLFRASYDANGNPVLVARGDDPEISGTADSGDRLTALGSTDVSFGPGGVVDAVGDLTLTRDQLGRIVAATETAATTYRRDCFGHIVAIDRSDGSTERFVAGPHGGPEAIVDSDGTTLAILAGGTRTSPPLLAVQSDRTLFLAADHVGSIRRVIDIATGEVIRSRDYDPWGRLLVDTGSAPVPHGFAGGIDDPDHDLVHFPARTYSTLLMRWLSRDPELFLGGSANLYSYANNDPVNYRDPTGTVVEICRRAADMWFAPDLVFPDKEHWWLRTTNEESGMISGGNDKVGVGDHSGQGDRAGSECDPVPDVDEECVDAYMQTPNVAIDGTRYGESLGYYGPGNTCQNWVDDVLSACSGGDYTVETEDPDAYDNWYGPDVNVAPYTPTESPPVYTPDPGQSTLDGGELWQ